MSKSQRNLVLQWGLLIAWSVIGPIALSRAADAPKPKAADDPAKAQLEKAVDAVAAAAKDSVANAANDQQAIRRAQLSLDILRNIGELGGFDTNPQIDKLMDDFRATAQPSVVEAVIVQQFNNKARTWFQMNDTERPAVLDPFVSEIKKSGLTHDYAEALARLAGMWGDRDPAKLLPKAIAEVLPSAKDPTDPKMKRVLATLEGIGRRLDLPGKATRRQIARRFDPRLEILQRQSGTRRLLCELVWPVPGRGAERS